MRIYPREEAQCGIPETRIDLLSCDHKGLASIVKEANRNLICLPVSQWKEAAFLKARWIVDSLPVVRQSSPSPFPLPTK